MFDNFNDLGETVNGGEKGTLVVAAAAEGDLLKALASARQLYLKRVILVGSPTRIEMISRNEGIDISQMEIIDVADMTAACEKAVAHIVSCRSCRRYGTHRSDEAEYQKYSHECEKYRIQYLADPCEYL